MGTNIYDMIIVICVLVAVLLILKGLVSFMKWYLKEL